MKFADMTWPLLREVPRGRTVVVAPVAACEQDSRHLPVFTDTLLVTAVAEGVEQRLPDGVLLLPSQWLRASAHPPRFGAPLSPPGGTHLHPLCGLLTPPPGHGPPPGLVLDGD